MPAITSPTIDQMLAMVNRWFDEKATAFAAPLSNASPETAALWVNDYQLMLNVTCRRVTLEDQVLEFLLEEPEEEEWHGAQQPQTLTGEWLPAVMPVIEQRLQALTAASAFRWLQFRVEGRFASTQGLQTFTLFDGYNDEAAAQLRRDMEHWQQTVLTREAGLTEPASTTFYCRHRLDTRLYPQPDLQQLQQDCERILQLNLAGPQREEHCNAMIYQLKQWSQQQFLPHYFTTEITPYRETLYHRKKQVPPPNEAAPEMALLCYLAILIVRYEPGYAQPEGKQLIKLMQQLGSQKARSLLREGSGAFSPDVRELQSEQLQASANDVLAEIALVIHEESAAAYQQALAFIIRLLALGFPRDYRIKLKSSVKNWLPVKGLARSDTHRFFASALTYPALHPLLATYVRSAIQPFAFYRDAEDEKCCMPGSYAIFGLALASRDYFPLLQHYLSQVDEEHQCVQENFLKTCAKHYKLNQQALTLALQRAAESPHNPI